MLDLILMVPAQAGASSQGTVENVKFLTKAVPFTVPTALKTTSLAAFLSIAIVSCTKSSSHSN